MPSNLHHLLERVHLGGIVKECVLTSGDDGFCSVQAIDMTNSLFVDVGMETELVGMGKLGLGNLAMLIRFLEYNRDCEINITMTEENRLELAALTGKLKFLLSEADLIPTVVENPNMMVELVDTYPLYIVLTKETVEELMSYYNIVKPTSIMFEFRPDSTTIHGGHETDHQFSIDSDPWEVREGFTVTGEPITVNVFAQYLMAILNVLSWDEEETPCILFTTEPEKPIVIQQNADCLWALVPAINE